MLDNYTGQHAGYDGGELMQHDKTKIAWVVGRRSWVGKDRFRPTSDRRPPTARRRGVIFVTALGVIVILTSLVLVFAQNMRTESMASANRLSYLQADAVEQGAEKWVEANVEINTADALTITQIPANALQLDNGYFWLLSPDGDSDQTYQYGIVDESSKLNINSATQTQLQALPNVTDDIAASIIGWRGVSTSGAPIAAASSSSTGSAATSTYYQSLPEPYAIKNAPFESLEELYLIENVDQTLMWGYDLNHDGVISAAEQSAGGASSTLGSVASGTRGIANDLTVYTTQTSSRISVNPPGGSPTALQNSLQKNISASRANSIITRLTTGNRGRLPSFTSLGDFYTQSGMTQDEFKTMAGKITASSGTVAQGLVNANTASRDVLAALLTTGSSSGADTSDADSLITARGGSGSSVSTSGLGWVVDALGPTKAGNILDSLTSQSYQYSADIVAVSPDGRSFKRVKIIVDDRGGTAKIVFRKDLTSLGWPLPDDIRTSLRSGKQIDVDQPNSSSLSNSVTGS